MGRYVIALAIVVACGCASETEMVAVPVPVTRCTQRLCTEPPQEVADSAKALGLSMLWEIQRECAEHDIGLIAGIFRISGHRNISMAFWGRDTKLTRTTIVRALEQPGARATNLKLAFYGDSSDAQIVRRAVIARGGTYIEAPMLSNNTLERTGDELGPRLAAASISCPAAQLGR